MTRINSAISVKNLTDEHLLAEHREIKRLPYILKQAINSGSIHNIPSKFTLGKGHILFFLDKMYFTLSRYSDIHAELLVRGFNVKMYYDNWDSVHFKYSHNYAPTEEERQLLIDRITERIMNSSKKVWHYYGEPITKEEAVKLLTKNWHHFGNPKEIVKRLRN